MKPITKVSIKKPQHKTNINDHIPNTEEQQTQDSEDTSCTCRFFKSIKDVCKVLSSIPPEPYINLYPF